MRNSLPTGFTPNPQAARVHGTDSDWYITLTSEATIHEVSALAYGFNVEVVSVSADGDLVMGPRSTGQPAPAQGAIERAIMEHVRPARDTRPTLAAVG